MHTPTPTLILLLTLPLLSSCKTTRQSQAPTTPNTAGLALFNASDIPTRPKIHPLDLDTENFRILGLRIGKERILRHETPLLNFQIPELADYVEVLRCPASLIIFGGADNFSEERQIAIRNEFWPAILATKLCSQLSSTLSEEIFADPLAPSGKYHYYLRACIHPERLQQNEDYTKTYCSRLIAQSNSYTQNHTRSNLAVRRLEQSQELRGKIETLHRRLVHTTKTLAEKLFDCQERHGQAVASDKEKEAIKNILVPSVAGAAAIGGGAVGMKTGPKAAAGGALIAGAVGTAAAFILNSAVVAGEKKRAGYPRDSDACYKNPDMQTFLQRNALPGSDAKTEAGELCTCAEAIGLKAELLIIKAEMQTAVQEQQAHIQILEQDTNEQ